MSGYPLYTTNSKGKLCMHILLDNNVTDAYGCDVYSKATDHRLEGLLG